jgi:hypothetical protein
MVGALKDLALIGVDLAKRRRVAAGAGGLRDKAADHAPGRAHAS